MQTIDIIKDNRKISIDYDEDTGKVLYVDYIQDGLPVEVPL